MRWQQQLDDVNENRQRALAVLPQLLRLQPSNEREDRGLWPAVSSTGMIDVGVQRRNPA
jgi:hypothetical protein